VKKYNTLTWWRGGSQDGSYWKMPLKLRPAILKNQLCEDADRVGSKSTDHKTLMNFWVLFKDPKEGHNGHHGGWVRERVIGRRWFKKMNRHGVVWELLGHFHDLEPVWNGKLLEDFGQDLTWYELCFMPCYGRSVKNRTWREGEPYASWEISVEARAASIPRKWRRVLRVRQWKW
jgi:hypothetical protein